MPAPQGNRNAAGKRVSRSRIAVNMGISKSNGLLDLFEQYLSLQCVPPTDEAVKELASSWAYQYWEERLKREIETQDAAIIV